MINKKNKNITEESTDCFQTDLEYVAPHRQRPPTPLFLSGAICVSSPYSFLHFPLSGAICVSARPAPAI